MKAFERFQISESMLNAVESLGFTHPTLVQERIIPKIGRNEQVIVQSETGSGKSHSFLIPIVDSVDVNVNEVQSIILAPTRELARQLYGMVQDMLPFFEEIKVSLFIGGTDIERDKSKADKVNHIIIGTPNRILSLIQEGHLNVSASSRIVIDEADLMIDLGFLETIDTIASRLSKNSQFLVFSATIPVQLRDFLRKYIGEVDTIVIDTPKNKVSIHYSLVPVKGSEKDEKLLKVIGTMQPYIGLIFTNSKDRADELFKVLLDKGVNVGLFHGGLKPRERKNEIKRIRDLEYEWVVASDLAARGLDIDGASHVINYDIPKDIEFFTHRVGRVGRGEYTGVAISLYEPKDEHLIDAIEKKGFTFKHEDVRDGELSEIKARTKRKTRQKQEANLERQLMQQVKRPKKVKPGYKKKMQEQLKSLKHDAKKKHSRQQRRGR